MLFRAAPSNVCACSDAEIRAIVDNNAIYLAPVWNPDGYVYVWTVRASFEDMSPNARLERQHVA